MLAGNMAISDNVTPLELEYLAVVNAAEESPLHELAREIGPRLGLTGDALVVVATRLLTDLVRRGVIGLERRESLDRSGVELSVEDACASLALVDNWAFPRPSRSSSWLVLYLTDSGEKLYSDGFESLPQTRVQELLFGAGRGATRIPG